MENDEIELFSPRKKKIKTLQTEETLSPDSQEVVEFTWPLKEEDSDDPDYEPEETISVSISFEPENSDDRDFIDLRSECDVSKDKDDSAKWELIEEQDVDDFVEVMREMENQRRELLKIRWAELMPLLKRKSRCDLFEADCAYHVPPNAEDKCPDTYICKQCLAELNKHN